MSLVKSNVQGDYASLVTPFLNTTGKSLMMMYRFIGNAIGELNIYISAEDLNRRLLMSLKGKYVML